VQSEYSLWTRDPEDVVAGAACDLGVGLVAYSTDDLAALEPLAAPGLRCPVLNARAVSRHPVLP
jgi:hypothetical protein